jgi:branched-chain amino acid transport system ATP-binding protein
MTELHREALLEARNLSRHFGGLAANSNVSMTLRRGEIHALLGPNGAGKSTFINMLSGDLPPSSGTILLKGDDVTALSAHRRSRIGIGRSFQRTNIFPTFSVRENCVLAAQSRQQRPARIFRPPLQNEAVVARSHEVMALTGLDHCGSQIAGTLSHGEQRQLEIAMVLATNPVVLLLDEPLAGMGTAEAERMIELMLRLTKDHAMLLVEHDIDAIFVLADHLTVMVNGQVIASGEPGAIRADPAVQAAYLGEGH